MRNVLGVIDRVNDWTGSVAKYFVVALVVVTVIDVIARYVLNAPTVWGYETSVMLGGSIIVLGWGYNQLHGAHVRVEVFYTHLSPRGQAIVNVLGALILFFPLFVAFLKASVSWMWDAWVTNEVMDMTFWYPPAGPFRTMVVVGVCLTFLQFLAQFIRDLYILIKREAL